MTARTKKIFNPIAVGLTAVALAVLLLGVSPASAAEPNGGGLEGKASTSAPNAEPGIPMDQIDPNSVTGRVNKAQTRSEAAKILVESGFKQSSKEGGVYEKTVAGLTVGFNLNESNQENSSVGARWALVWRGTVPYLRGTVDEWKVAAEDGLAVGSAGCVFITNVFGAAGCIAVANLASNWVGRYDTSDWPKGMCLGITPVQTAIRAIPDKCS